MDIEDPQGGLVARNVRFHADLRYGTAVVLLFTSRQGKYTLSSELDASSQM